MFDAPESRAARSSKAGSLDTLIALSSELAALARAGVPLERGLAALGTDSSGRLKQAVDGLSARLAAGQSLPTAIAEQPRDFPPLFRAVVDAGLRSGRLGAALESLSLSTRRLRDVQHTVGQALAYPAGVVLLALTLFVFVVTKVLPGFSPLYDRGPPSSMLALGGLAAHVEIWSQLVPLLVVLGFVVWWQRAKRALVLGDTGNRLLGWLPGVNRLLANARAAAMSELLALLVEQGVPLHESVLLAAEAAGDPAARRSAKDLASQLQQGNLPTSAGQTHVFALVARWMVVSNGNQSALLSMVRHSARIYRERALRQSEWLRFYLPAVLTVAIGGSVCLAFCLSVFGPYAQLLRRMADRF